MNLVCFDTSAIVKLIREEPESASLRRWLAAPARQQIAPVCSALALTEIPRALRRIAPGAPLPDFRDVLDRFTLRSIDEGILTEAGSFSDPLLRCLDAIHLATARTLFANATESFEALVTYDLRLASAANAFGLPVVTPRDSGP